MARDILLPGGGVFHEDGTDDVLVPGAGVFHEDQAAAAGGIEVLRRRIEGA